MSAKSKGSSGEREACEWLERKLFGRDVGLKRNLNQSRDGGADIIHHPFVFEVKRRKGDKNLGFYKWWIQVVKATKWLNIRCSVDTYTPVVMFRIDFSDWQFLISANQLDGPTQGWLHMDAMRFIQWAKTFAKIN